MNIGNTYLAEGDFATAKTYYSKASDLGSEHINHSLGSTKDGKNMVAASLKCLARGYKVTGNIDEAKRILKKVVEEGRVAMELEKMEQESETKLREEEAKAKVAGAPKIAAN